VNLVSVLNSPLKIWLFFLFPCRAPGSRAQGFPLVLGSRRRFSVSAPGLVGQILASGFCRRFFCSRCDSSARQCCSPKFSHRARCQASALTRSAREPLCPASFSREIFRVLLSECVVLDFHCPGCDSRFCAVRWNWFSSRFARLRFGFVLPFDYCFVLGPLSSCTRGVQ
jgi:hypothetical protein